MSFSPLVPHYARKGFNKSNSEFLIKQGRSKIGGLEGGHEARGGKEVQTEGASCMTTPKFSSDLTLLVRCGFSYNGTVPNWQ